LINKETLETKFVQHSAPKRPSKMDADIKYVKIKGEEFCVAIGTLENKPYEVFAWLVNEDSIQIQPSEDLYFIVKVSSGNYNLVNKDGIVFGAIRERLTDEQAAITRLVSTALRHGTDIKFIVEQLDKTKGDLTSFSKAISRVLKQYITNGSHLKGSMCEVCGSKLIITNGCESCTCGYTKCS